MVEWVLLNINQNHVGLCVYVAEGANGRKLTRPAAVHIRSRVNRHAHTHLNAANRERSYYVTLIISVLCLCVFLDAYC